MVARARRRAHRRLHYGKSPAQFLPRDHPLVSKLRSPPEAQTHRRPHDRPDQQRRAAPQPPRAQQHRDVRLSGRRWRQMVGQTLRRIPSQQSHRRFPRLRRRHRINPRRRLERLPHPRRRSSAPLVDQRRRRPRLHRDRSRHRPRRQDRDPNPQRRHRARPSQRRHDQRTPAHARRAHLGPSRPPQTA